jgi:parallel beta-helix repeat protein
MSFSIGLIICLGVLAAYSPNVGLLSSSVIIYVDDDNTSGIEDGSLAHPYNTIQEGVDAANSGDTVMVFSGTYYENVSISKSLNLIGEDNTTTIIDSGGHMDGILVIGDDVNIEGFYITGSGLVAGDAGIELKNSQSCSLLNNNIVSNKNYGIYLRDSKSNLIEGNTISSNRNHGIYLYYSRDNEINNNLISSNEKQGINFYYSNYNKVTGNNVSFNNQYNIYLYSSNGSTLKGNTMIENGLFIMGNRLQFWNTHDIDSSNTVNGKSIYYLKNQIGGSVPLDAGQVILANCQNVIIEDQVLDNGPVDILLGFSSYNIIRNNIISKNAYSIYLYFSNNNNITGNNVSLNQIAGIYLDGSENNLIIGNYLALNKWEGIHCAFRSNGNIILGNTILNNYIGIYLDSVSSNKLSNNIMIENGVHIKGNLLEQWNTHSIDASNTICGKPVYYLKNQEGGNVPQDAGQVILANCINVTIKKQEIDNGTAGIIIAFSSFCNITNNNVSSNNMYGIYLTHSPENSIYHNNFIDNTNQGYDDTGDNSWDIGWPQGGNYWSDYMGYDWHHGPNQDWPGSDTIGDLPYLIGPIGPHDESKDRYPLRRPWVPPVANPGSYQTVFEGEIAQFDGSGSFSPYGDIEVFEWDFDARIDSDGDGITTNDVNGTGPTASCIYGDDGMYDVTLTIKTAISGNVTRFADQDVVLLIDSSGSMEWNDQKNLRLSAAKNYVDNLKPFDRVAVVDFDYRARILQNLTMNYSAAKDAIDQVDSSGGTRISPGLNLSNTLLKNNGSNDTVWLIIQITDGKVHDITESIREAKKSRDLGIKIFTIGLKVHAPILGNISNITGGRHYYAPDSSFLNSIYQEISMLTEYYHVLQLFAIGSTQVTVNNLPPTIEPFGPFKVDENSAFSINATAYDPGSDDLTFTWEFELGSTITNEHYNDGIRPDPFPSPGGIFPYSKTDYVSTLYDEEGNYTIVLTVTDDDGGVAVYETFVIVNDVPDNTPPSILFINYTIFKNAPRTIGYWGHQCNVDEPYGDHTGILQDWIDNISTQSQVFSGISTKEESENILEKGSAENMTVMAKRQLMGLWFNLVSGKLHPMSEIELFTLTSSKTLWDAIQEIESVILDSPERSELERVKDIADEINNGIGIASAFVEFHALATDTDPDDLYFHWDFGGGATYDNFYPNVNGSYPVEVTDYVTHSYFFSGTFPVTLTVTDNDGEEDEYTISVNIP